MTYVQYDKDTKVATSGSTCTFYRISVTLDENGKKALMGLRKGNEPLRFPLERILELGIQSAVRQLSDEETMKELHERAYKRNPRDVMNLDELYHSSDLSNKEYVHYLKIFANED